MKRFALLALLCLLTTVARAQNDKPLSPDRPTFSNGPDTVEAGRVQLESGYQFQHTGDQKDNSYGQLLLRIGAGEKAEARVGLNSYHVTRDMSGRTFGFEDSLLGVKYKLAEGAETFDFSRPQAALLVETTLPTGAPAFRENTLQPSAGLILNWNASSHFQFGANLTGTDASQSGRHLGEFMGTLNAQYGMSKRVNILLDYYVDRVAGGEMPNQNYFDGGITYLTDNDTQFDINGGVGVNNHQHPDFFLGAGISRRF